MLSAGSFQLQQLRDDNTLLDFAERRKTVVPFLLRAVLLLPMLAS